jgi:hypothetical protein
MANYGRQLAELRTRVRPVESAPMDGALADAQKAAAEAAAALEGVGTSASHQKFLPFRYGLKVYTEQRLHFMQVLREMGAAAANGSGVAAHAAAGSTRDSASS